MNPRTRIFAGVLVLFAAGVGYLLYQIIRDLEPRYRESVEEPLVDTAAILAALIAADSPVGAIDIGPFRRAFAGLYQRRLDAQIYRLKKTEVDLRVYVTDRRGIVLFDSTGQDEGADYSRWNDVRLTLAGRYGARTTRDTPNHPESSVMYVAAPIVSEGEILGVLTVGKPTSSIQRFIEITRERILAAGITALLALVGLGLLLSIWLVRPLGVLGDYLRLVREARRMPLPRLGRSALNVLGAAFDEMREALAGRGTVEQYVEALTHEIKSPLSAVRGAAELLGEDLPPAERRRFIRNLQDGTRRIQEVVDRLLDLASLEARRGLAEVHPVAMAELLAEVMNAMRAIAERRGVGIELEGGEDLVVRGDRFLLQRALTNLVQNAIDFSSAATTVTVRVEAIEKTCQITVMDQGSGIPDYALDRVFERFYSLPRSGPEHAKGTGLGLSFVREIADLHRGTVDLQNRPGGGAIATLTLPLAPAPPNSP